MNKLILKTHHLNSKFTHHFSAKSLPLFIKSTSSPIHLLILKTPDPSQFPQSLPTLVWFPVSSLSSAFRHPFMTSLSVRPSTKSSPCGFFHPLLCSLMAMLSLLFLSILINYKNLSLNSEVSEKANIQLK